MENKNNISKLTKILFVALAMGMILISPYQLCNVAAADKYYGYQKKTKSVKTKITASKKKVRIKKKYRGTRTTKNVESKWSDSYKYTYGDAKKIHIKTVITTQKTYHGYFITTKRNIKTTTTENKINFGISRPCRHRVHSKIIDGHLHDNIRNTVHDCLKSRRKTYF